MKFAIVFVLLLALSACAMAKSKKKKPEKNVTKPRMHPLCPTLLKTENQRYVCYSKIGMALVMGIITADPTHPEKMAEIFAPMLDTNIKGRTSAGAFEGIPLNAEYLAAAAASFYASGKVLLPNVTITNYATSGNVASFIAQVTIVDAFDSRLNANWTFTGWGRMSNTTNLITHYEIIFERFSELLFAMGSMFQNQTVQMAHNIAISKFLCNKTQIVCTGKNQQYDNISACVNYLVANAPYIGHTGDAASNCLICRVVHSILLPFDPDMHCVHVGPTGGDACNDKPYARYFSFWDDDEFVGNQGKPYIPHGRLALQ